METNTISARTRPASTALCRGVCQAELGDEVARSLRQQVRNSGIQYSGDYCRDFRRDFPSLIQEIP